MPSPRIMPTPTTTSVRMTFCMCVFCAPRGRPGMSGDQGVQVVVVDEHARPMPYTRMKHLRSRGPLLGSYNRMIGVLLHTPQERSGAPI